MINCEVVRRYNLIVRSKVYLAQDRNAHQVILILALVLPFLFFFQAFPNYRNPNELSRLLLTSAIVDDGSFQIDHALQRYGQCQDISYYKGHYYSNKAIGYSVLAVPFYYLSVDVLGIHDYDVLVYVLKIFLNLIPMLFFSALLLHCFHKDLDAGAMSYVLLAAFLFGTLAFPYTQVFASHLITGLIWFTAFYLIVHRQSKRLALMSGMLVGLSFLVELPSLLVIPLFLIWLAWKKRELLLPFAAGCALLSLPVFVYNVSVFDGPLNWSYKFASGQGLPGVVNQGYVGEHIPSPWVAWQLLFGSNRGFFHYQPHLIIGVAGLVAAWRRRPECWLIAGIAAANFAFYSGYTVWDGGWSFGPRFLVPLVPFFAYASALWFSNENPAKERWISRIYLVLLGLTVPEMLMGSATFLLSPRFLTNILVWQTPVLFWNGFFGLNWGDVIGLNEREVQGIAIILVYVPVIVLIWKSGAPRRQWVAFLVPSLLILLGTGVLQPWMEARIPAAHCAVIGRTGYIQGHHSKALHYLELARARATNPAVAGETDSWIALTEQKLGTRAQPPE